MTCNTLTHQQILQLQKVHLLAVDVAQADKIIEIKVGRRAGTCQRYAHPVVGIRQVVEMRLDIMTGKKANGKDELANVLLNYLIANR